MDTLYVTGGGSELPPVARILREEFGKRVRRSAYMRSATAIGLAIRADRQSGFVLRDQFMRNFGLWRETGDGRAIAFDLLSPRGTALPGPGEPSLRSTRSYRPAHNIGHFRYLECTGLTEDGRPLARSPIGTRSAFRLIQTWKTGQIFLQYLSFAHRRQMHS